MTGQRIIDGLKDAVAGNFSRVTIDGQVWVRADSVPALPASRAEAIKRMQEDGDADPEGTAKLNWPHLFGPALPADVKHIVEDVRVFADHIDRNGYNINAKRLHEAATALESLASRAEEEWRFDIENAPKDGTRILAVYDEGEARGGLRIDVVTWEKFGKKPYWRSIATATLFGERHMRAHQPFGWQPLPAPPAREGGGS